jgi:hypothetical protein
LRYLHVLLSGAPTAIHQRLRPPKAA